MSSELAKVQAEISPEADTISQGLVLLRGYQIVTQDDYTEAAELCKLAKIKHDKIDAERKKLTVPINAGLKAINDFFRPVLTNLKTSEDILKTKMSVYVDAEECKRRTAMAANSTVYLAGGTPTDIIPEPPKATGVAMRKVWKFEVTDPEIVPRQFCSPDPDKIKASRDWSMYSVEYPPPAIDGIRFYQDTTVSVGTK